jgi:hypothetical protein
MIHPDYNWFEMRVAGKLRRSLVPNKHVPDELEKLGTRPTDVHLSISRYSQDIVDYRDENDGSVSGYKGKSYADYIPIDIDGPSMKELDEAVETVRMAVEGLKDWGLCYEDVAIYFSGRRGFHVLIPSELFAGLAPSDRFHDLMFETVVELFRQGPLIKTAETESEKPVIKSEHIDFGPYSRLHMLRMPGTIHEKTELWKIPLRKKELMEGTPEEAAQRIRTAAESRRPTYSPDVTPTDRTRELGDTLQGRVESDSLKYRRRSDAVGTMNLNDYLTASDMRNLDKPGYGRFAVEARKTMKALSGGLSEGESIEDMGGRHDVLCHLVGKLKNQFDMPQDWAAALLHHWNQSNTDPLPEREFEHVIRDLYRS